MARFRETIAVPWAATAWCFREHPSDRHPSSTPSPRDPSSACVRELHPGDRPAPRSPHPSPSRQIHKHASALCQAPSTPPDPKARLARPSPPFPYAPWFHRSSAPVPLEPRPRCDTCTQPPAYCTWDTSCHRQTTRQDQGSVRGASTNHEGRTAGCTTRLGMSLRCRTIGCCL